MSEDYIARTISAYDSSPDKYVSSTSEMINLPEINTLVGLLPDVDSPVLDAGCAFGRDSAVMASKGLKTIGIDMSDELLVRAKALHPDNAFEKMDVRELKFPDNHFSGIWCNAVQCYFI